METKYGNNENDFINRFSSNVASMGVSLLISTIQGMIYDFRREKRELEREKRDLEYHTKRMNDYK